jgi:hypothetical protein
MERPQRLPPVPQRAYLSVTRIVVEVPSAKLFGIAE